MLFLLFLLILISVILVTQVSFTDVPVSDANVLGGYGSGKAVSNELLAYGNFYLGAAVVGFMKKLLCKFFFIIFHFQYATV